MIFTQDSLILAEKLVIYNNLGEFEDLRGRLFAELQIYPTPRILWDFEILGTKIPEFHEVFANKSLLQSYFSGYLLDIESLILKEISFGDVDISSRARGIAFEASYLDDLQSPAHKFNFYLTNTRFQRIIHCHVFDEHCDGGVIEEIPLNSTWAIRLEISKQACKWLDTRKDNIGVHLTGFGTLFQLNTTQESEGFPDSLATLKMKEAKEMLDNLSWLLSYANGGFIAPIFIEGEKYNKYKLEEEDPESQDIIGTETTSTLIGTAYQFTSLEKLGVSWLTEYSNLEGFISCFKSFEKMLDKPFWKKTFYFVIVQYFQAISSKNWELAASATGAALERLSHAILVEDENDLTAKARCELLFDIRRSEINKAKTTWNLGHSAGQENISTTGKRLRLMLERIGLTESRGCFDIHDVQDFLSVRNDAVHPKVSNITQEKRWQAIVQGIQWIDEVLLWRLGYDGNYLDRITGSIPSLDTTDITPRYDLFCRDPSW